MHRLLRCALFVAALAVPVTAAAQEDPRKAQAAPLFAEGHRFAEKNQYAEALDRFRKAYAIYPSPNTLFNVAQMEQQLGRKLDALRDYRESAKNPVVLADIATEAKANIATLERSLARVKLTGPEGTKVRVGDVEYTLPLVDPVDVEPGRLTLQGTHAGESLSAVADAKPGTLVSVELTKTSPGIVETPPVAPTEPSPVRWIVPAALGVVGITGIVLGVVFVGKGNSANDEAKALPLGQGCLGVASTACDRASSLHDDWKTDRTVSTVSFVSGVVFLAAAGATAIFWPRESSANRAAIVPVITPTHAGVMTTLTF